MSYQLVEDAFGDLRNANALMRASDIAYLPEAEGRKAFLDDFGLEAKLFSVDNTQAYLAQNDDHIVVAFRGTESPTSIDGLKDWLLTDAVNLLIVPGGRLGADLSAAGVGAKFHKGFADAIAEIWGPLGDAVEAETKRLDRPLWVTGHSLGGALALLCGWLLQRRFIGVHQIATYGGPMIGNAAACAAFDKVFAGKVFRYVNGKDPVPKLPAMSLVANEFVHVQKEMPLGSDRITPLSEFLGSLASKAVSGIMERNVADEVWQFLSTHIDAHYLPYYRKLLG